MTLVIRCESGSLDKFGERVPAPPPAIAQPFIDRSTNIAMVHAYRLTGHDIAEVEQTGDARARYGDELVRKLAQRLTERFGRGFSPRTVRRIRQFYSTYAQGSTLTVEPGILENRTTLLAKSDTEEIRTTLLAKSSQRIVPSFHRPLHGRTTPIC